MFGYQRSILSADFVASLTYTAGSLFNSAVNKVVLYKGATQVKPVQMLQPGKKRIINADNIILRLND